MTSLEMLEAALAAAQGRGYRVRHAWLECEGGGCEINGQKWLFLDLALSPSEQLEVVLDVLRREGMEHKLEGQPATAAAAQRSAAA